VSEGILSSEVTFPGKCTTVRESILIGENIAVGAGQGPLLNDHADSIIKGKS
jgi:hypothetical protein